MSHLGRHCSCRPTRLPHPAQVHRCHQEDRNLPGFAQRKAYMGLLGYSGPRHLARPTGASRSPIIRILAGSYRLQHFATSSSIWSRIRDGKIDKEKKDDTPSNNLARILDIPIQESVKHPRSPHPFFTRLCRLIVDDMRILLAIIRLKQPHAFCLDSVTVHASSRR